MRFKKEKIIKILKQIIVLLLIDIKKEKYVITKIYLKKIIKQKENIVIEIIVI